MKSILVRIQVIRSCFMGYRNRVDNQGEYYRVLQADVNIKLHFFFSELYRIKSVFLSTSASKFV
jgi:hypothetical protein